MNVDQQLRDVADRIAYPAEPDITAAVVNRISREPEPAWWRRPQVLAAAVVAAAIVLVVGLIPAARDQVASWLGIRGVTVETVPPTAAPPPTMAPSTATSSPPTTEPVSTAAPVASGLGAGLTLGQEIVSLTVEQVAGFAPLYPELGLPDREFVDAGGRVWMLYAVRDGLPETVVPGVGMIVTQFAPDSPGITKQVAVGGVELFDFGDNLFGLWLEGPHELLLIDADGSAVDGRSAGNTLLWEQGDLTLRIETALSRDEAVAIAETFE